MPRHSTRLHGNAFESSDISLYVECRIGGHGSMSSVRAEPTKGVNSYVVLPVRA